MGIPSVILCAITDGAASIDSITRIIAAGVDWLQIREKHLSARELLSLCQAARSAPNPHKTRLFVNGRADVALAAGLDGVHLPEGSPSAASLRPDVPAGFLIGASCHSLAGLRRAEAEGADYTFYSPIFPSRSKPGYGPPLGLPALREACQSIKTPVLALGGVDHDNAAACIQAGAAGLAAISLFAPCENLGERVARLRALA